MAVALVAIHAALVHVVKLGKVVALLRGIALIQGTSAVALLGLVLQVGIAVERWDAIQTEENVVPMVDIVNLVITATLSMASTLAVRIRGVQRTSRTVLHQLVEALILRMMMTQQLLDLWSQYLRQPQIQRRPLQLP
jgi:hypothetical protein